MDAETSTKNNNNNRIKLEIIEEKKEEEEKIDTAIQLFWSIRLYDRASTHMRKRVKAPLLKAKANIYYYFSENQLHKYKHKYIEKKVPVYFVNVSIRIVEVVSIFCLR